MSESLTLSSQRRRIFVACWITYAGYYLGRVNLALALPSLQAEFGWTKTTAGLIGTLFYWTYALGQLINGQLGDRISPRRMVAIGLVCSALLNILFGLQCSLAFMLGIWVLNGWAQSTGWGPIMKILSRWFDPSQRGKLIARFSPCYVVGHAVSWALGGWLIATLGWRSAFWVPGVLMGLIALTWYAIARDAPPKARSEPEQDESPAETAQIRPSIKGLWHAFPKLLANPQLRWGLATCFLSGMIKDGLTLWGPTFLVEQQGISLARAGMIATLIPLAGIGGSTWVSWLLHRIQDRADEKIVLLLSGLLAIGALALFALDGFGGLVLAMAMLLLVALNSYGINILLMTSLPLSLGPGGQVSSAAGTLDFVSYVGGGLGGILVGLLQDMVGWTVVYAFWSVAAMLIALLAWRHTRSQRTASHRDNLTH